MLLKLWSGSKILKIARKAGLKAAREVFADRAYHEDGSLVSRKAPGAVITDSSEITERVIRMITEKKVTTLTGIEIDLEPDTICVHGDTPDAAKNVKYITKALQQEGIDVVPVGSFL